MFCLRFPNVISAFSWFFVDCIVVSYLVRIDSLLKLSAVDDFVGHRILVYQLPVFSLLWLWLLPIIFDEIYVCIRVALRALMLRGY